MNINKSLLFLKKTPLENIHDSNERMARIKSPDSDVFKKAYLELREATRHAKKYFQNTAIFPQLKTELAKYTPRFNRLCGNPR